METRSRPLGVTILAILAGINGIVSIAVGIIASLIFPPAGIIGIVIGLIWLGLAWGYGQVRVGHGSLQLSLQ